MVWILSDYCKYKVIIVMKGKKGKKGMNYLVILVNCKWFVSYLWLFS